MTIVSLWFLYRSCKMSILYTEYRVHRAVLTKQHKACHLVVLSSSRHSSSYQVVLNLVLSFTGQTYLQSQMCASLVPSYRS